LDQGGTEQVEKYTFSYGKGTENYPLVTGFFLHKRIVLAVKSVELVSDRTSYIVLGGCWCDILVLNAHAVTKDKSDDSKDSLYEELGQVFDQFPKDSMKILFGDSSAKLGREVLLKSTIWNDSLCENTNDNGVRVVNFATSKNLVVKSTIFLH
jgi:hypothetical protein